MYFLRIVLLCIGSLFISTTYAMPGDMPPQYHPPYPPFREYQQNGGTFPNNPNQQQQTNNISNIAGMPAINLRDEIKQLFDKTGYKYFQKYSALKLFDIPKGD